MNYNQFSYIPVNATEALSELQVLGFPLSTELTDKENLESFLKQTFLHFANKDYPLTLLAADDQTDALTFFKSDKPLSEDIFYYLILQVLGFVPQVDFSSAKDFITKTHFPILFDNIIQNLHQLLATRTKAGNTLIDQLVADGLLPVDNSHHFFNGKALATFDTDNLIREVVYVEAPLDTMQTGQLDLVKVNIIRPQVTQPIPTMMTASPYHQGTNDVAADKKTYKMEGKLSVKPAGKIDVETHDLALKETRPSTAPESPAEETFTHIDSYSLNDYFLARGFANIYVSGVGTAGSTGFMTSGDYAQIESFKAVIDWLNGRANAYTSHRRDKQVKANWASGLVATTGKSYLGTMSTGLATTAVDGLKVIIAEAGISSWYDYYRENGLLCSPGGYPGEDLDVLTELTYSKNLWAGDRLRNNARYQDLLDEQSKFIDRASGDYNQYWHDRNYLPHADKVEATVVYTHGLQDWNVKPRHVYNIFNALPEHVQKHLFLHQGQHVYMHNWQSIDFRESMNALLSQKLLGVDNGYDLPKVIWQDNSAEQTWRVLEQFGQKDYLTLPLGKEKELIDNHYCSDDFKRYGKDFNVFKAELFAGKANQILLDLYLQEDLRINGEITLNLVLKSSENKGLISAQVLDYGHKKRFKDIPSILSLNAMDNGRNFSREALRELPFKSDIFRVVTKGVLNLQNRSDLLTVEEIPSEEWMTVSLNLQPSIYQLKKGDTIRVLLYTTDFEHTIRDNSNYAITVDLAQSSIQLPH